MRGLSYLPLLAILGAGCTSGLFSGTYFPSRSRPVARIETRGGYEYGATTRDGILFLGRTATSGPCRVHYFVGQDLVVEDGTIHPAGGVYYRAEIDLKTQAVPLLPRDIEPTDQLVALALRGNQIEEVPVQLAHGPFIDGDLLADPGRPLGPGTGIFVRDQEDEEKLFFVGLVAGVATLATPGGTERYLAFTGSDQLRIVLLQQEAHPSEKQVIYRPDDINVFRSINERQRPGKKDN